MILLFNIQTISKLQKMCEKYNPDKKNDKEEEIYTKIKRKKEANPDIKLAKPDQWIYELFSINHLEIKLKIFSFRFRNNFSFPNPNVFHYKFWRFYWMKSPKLTNRFCLEVENICAALKSLELALSDVRSCEPFVQIIKLILEIGNFLNGKEDSGFNILELLPKLHDLTDVANNKPLLYHVIKASQWLFQTCLIDFEYFDRNCQKQTSTSSMISMEKSKHRLLLDKN